MNDKYKESIYPIEVQKLIAFSVIGYLEVLKRDGYADADLNAVFKPMATCKALTLLKFDGSIIDALYQFDEMEALRDIASKSLFEKSIDDLILPIITFLKNSRASSEGSKATIERLLELR